MNLLRADAFTSEVLASALFGGEEDIRDGVRDEPIDLFRHGAVTGAEAGLDVGDGNVELGGRQRRRQRGVHIPHHERQVCLQCLEDGFEASHDFGRLDRVRPGPDTEVEVRRRDFELLEELRRHLIVIVLAGVHEDRSDPRIAPHRPAEIQERRCQDIAVLGRHLGLRQPVPGD